MSKPSDKKHNDKAAQHTDAPPTYTEFDPQDRSPLNTNSETEKSDKPPSYESATKNDSPKANKKEKEAANVAQEPAQLQL